MNIEEIKGNLNFAELEYYGEGGKAIVFLLSIIEQAEKALKQCKEYENKSNCNYCGGGISEIIDPVLRMITQ